MIRRTALKPRSKGIRRSWLRRSKKIKPGTPAVKVFRDGREVCQQNEAGKKEYQHRLTLMYWRQFDTHKGFVGCCNCRGRLARSQATFEHENGRGLGGGTRDDRIEIDGKPLNGASHLICNSERGSKRTPIWHGEI